MVPSDSNARPSGVLTVAVDIGLPPFDQHPFDQHPFDQHPFDQHPIDLHPVDQHFIDQRSHAKE